MPDLPNREKRESALALALRQAWKPHVGPWESIDQAKLAQDTRTALEPALYDVALVAGLGIDGGRIDQIPIERRTAEWAGSRAATLAAQTTATTLARLRAGLEPATAFSDARIAGIATTEVTRAVTAGEVITLGLLFGAFDDKMRAIWNTAGDEMVCEVCGPLDGTGREVFGTVAPDGPPVHPWCRCWLEWEEV